MKKIHQKIIQLEEKCFFQHLSEATTLIIIIIIIIIITLKILYNQTADRNNIKNKLYRGKEALSMNRKV